MRHSLRSLNEIAPLFTSNLRVHLHTHIILDGINLAISQRALCECLPFCDAPVNPRYAYIIFSIGSVSVTKKENQKHFPPKLFNGELSAAPRQNGKRCRRRVFLLIILCQKQISFDLSLGTYTTQQRSGLLTSPSRTSRPAQPHFLHIQMYERTP